MLKYAASASLIALAMVPTASAHSPLSPIVKVIQTKDVIVLETGLFAQDLASFDTNGDGQISKGEFAAQDDQIRLWLQDYIVLQGRDGRQLSPSFEDAPVPHYSELAIGDSIEGVRLIRKYELSDTRQTCLALTSAGRDTRQLIVKKGANLLQATLPASGQCTDLL